jgi:hypothetical protein
MRGLPPEERALMMRIGDLMDVALNNRQASNPFEPRRNKPSRVIYPPTGLAAATGIKAVKLTWTAPPSDEHLRYEIEVLNIAKGTTETKTSFTNNITYYGPGGIYEAKVRSVGRDGSSSTLEKITFDIGSDVMQLEGAKLAVDELGTLVQDDILHLSGYKIFVWGSVVIDEYIAGAGNPDIVFKLWRKEGDDATFTAGGAAPLELMETIVLFPATADASNLSADALGGQEGYTRFPVPESLGSVRTGSFGTAQSVMFSPIPVAADEVDKRWTYFLQAVNRESQSDEVGLSITIWAGAEGAANAQPGDPYVAPTPYSGLHRNHFHTWNHYEEGHGPNDWDSRWAVAQILEGYVLTANSWTLNLWWRPDRMDHFAQEEDVNNYPAAMSVFQRDSLVHTFPHDDAHNQITWVVTVRQRDFDQEWQGDYQSQGWVHQMDIGVGSRYGADAEDFGERIGISHSTRALIMDDEKGISALFPWSVHPDHYSASTNDGWYFTSINFEGSFNEDPNGPPKLRVWQNIGVSTDPEDMFNNAPPEFHKDGMRQLEFLIEDPDLIYGENNTDFFGDPLPDNRIGPMYMNNPQFLHIFPIVQDDKLDRIQGFGCTLSHAHRLGQYDGSGENVSAFAIQFYQGGLWSTSMDSWDGITNSENGGYATNLGGVMIAYLYNEGRGYVPWWSQNATPTVEGQEYVLGGSLCSHWQFGQVASSFYLHEALRDTGWWVYGGSLNMTSEIFPHAEGHEGNSPLEPTLGPESWGNTTGIWDVRTPSRFGSTTEGAGPNGTTRSPICYPGMNMPIG